MNIPVMIRSVFAEQAFDTLGYDGASHCDQQVRHQISSIVIIKPGDKAVDVLNEMGMMHIGSGFCQHDNIFMRGKVWACADAREGQAYNIQNQWLEGQGHYPFVKASWIARVSSCGSQTAELAAFQPFGG